jgi:hypothetical protein
MELTTMNERRFRWELVLVPLTILVVAWFLSGIELTFTWTEVMERLNVQNQKRYSRLAQLGLAVVAVCAIWRVLRRGEDSK